MLTYLRFFLMSIVFLFFNMSCGLLGAHASPLDPLLEAAIVSTPI